MVRMLQHTWAELFPRKVRPGQTLPEPSATRMRVGVLDLDSLPAGQQRDLPADAPSLHRIRGETHPGRPAHRVGRPGWLPTLQPPAASTGRASDR